MYLIAAGISAFWIAWKYSPRFIPLLLVLAATAFARLLWALDAVELKIALLDGVGGLIEEGYTGRVSILLAWTSVTFSIWLFEACLIAILLKLIGFGYRLKQ